MKTVERTMFWMMTALILVPSAWAAPDQAPAKADKPSAAAEPQVDKAKMAAFFNVRCAACHTIGHGDRVGPDLKGVTSRRSQKWLTGYISNPDDYLAKDEDAKKLLKKFHGVRMPNPKLTPAQVDGLVRYFASLDGPAKKPSIIKNAEPAKDQAKAAQ